MFPNKLPGTGMKVKNEAVVGGLPEGVLFLMGTFYRCTLCKCHIYGRANMQAHVNAARHQDKFLNNADVASLHMRNDQILPRDVVMTDNPNIFWCQTCFVKISGYKCVFQHVEGLNHNKKKMGLSNSTLNINSNSSKSNSKINSNKGLQLDGKKIKQESLPSSPVSQVYCSSDQSVNIQESKTTSAKKKKKDRKRREEVIIDTSNIVSASTQKIQSVVKISSSGKKIGACEIYPENKKSPGLNNSFECDSCNIKLRGYTELLNHVRAGKCTQSTVKKLNKPKNYKFAVKSPGKLEITRFVDGEEVEAVDIPEEFFRISRGFYYCLSCRFTLTGGESIFRHAKAAAHQENLIKRIEEDKDYIFTETSPGKWKIVRFSEGKEMEAVDIPEIFMHIASTNYYCLSCSYDLIGCEAILEHAKVIAHGEDFNKEYGENNSMNKSAMIDGKSGLIEEPADVQELPPHIVFTEKENVYRCQICCTKISSYKCISEHENGAKHRKKMNSLAFTFDQSLFSHITVISERKDDYWCEVCSVLIRGSKTLVQHVNSPKHMNKVEIPLNLPIFGDCPSAGVSNKKKGKSIPMISNGIDCKRNHCPPSSSLPSLEDHALLYGNIGLNSMAGHIDGELNNNKELMCESVKSICSPGDEVFMTLCRICKEVILGDELTLMEHVNSKRHATQVVDLYLQGSILELDMKPKFDKHDAIKYFVADKQAEGDESLINVVEVLENKTKDTGICFTWCRACRIKSYDDSRLDEHLKSRFHLKNFQGKFITGKFFDARDDNDDSESNEEINQHKYYPEGIKEIHGEDYFLCTICNGLKLFDENSLFEHVKSLVHMNNQQRSFGSGETQEDEDFFNEINCKTSGESSGRDETFPTSEENEKALQDTEISFSEGSYSFLSYGQSEGDYSIELYPGSDGSEDCYRMGDEDVEFEDESSVIESASTSLIPENIRAPKKRTAAPLGEVYNIKGTDIWVCLTCEKHNIYTLRSMNEHLTSRQHSEGKRRMLDKAPKQLKITSFEISPQFRSKGIFEIPTMSFAVCALCKCKLSSKTQVEAHLSDVQHQALKNSIISGRNGGKFKSIWPLSSHESLPDGIEEFYNKDFVLCTLCKKHFRDRWEMGEHVRHPDHMKKKNKVIFKIDDDEFRCKKCGINLSGYSSLVNHLNSQKHM